MTTTRHPLVGEIRGGLVSASVSIPLAIGYGMFAFIALGDAYFGHGILAGFYTAIAATLVCLLIGDRTATLYAPRVLTTFYLGALLYGLAHSQHPGLQGGGIGWVLAVFITIICAGGVIQAGFGALRLGSIIKFIPHPVLAGFHNAGAILLLLVQLGNVLGLEHHVPFMQVPFHLGEAHAASIAVAAAAFLAAWQGRKWLPKVPPVVTGLVTGTASHYAILLAAGPQALGPLLGPPADAAPLLSQMASVAMLVADPRLPHLLPLIAAGALGLALVASIDTLLCARLLEPATGIVPDPDRQLMRLGLANVVSAAVGGITASFNLGPTLANRAYGGRGVVSVLVNCAATLAAITALVGLIAWLPRAALSGVIMVIAIQHLDPWTTRLIARLWRRQSASRAGVGFDLLLAVLVTVMSVVLDIVTAVFAGIAISFVLFAYRMGGSLIRESYRCDSIRSRKTRAPVLADYLAAKAGSILVIELEGAVFFGSAERLGEHIARAVTAPTSHVILDFKRVSEIDSTGAQSLLQIQRRLDRGHRRLLLCGVRAGRTWRATLADQGVLDAVGGEYMHPDTDRAIEAAEEELLRERSTETVALPELPLSKVDLLKGMASRQQQDLLPLLERRSYAAGDIVFREGDPGHDMFIIVRGSASVRLRERGGGEIRLVTFDPGTVFGELAIMDSQRRSATVQADEALVCWVLSARGFDDLRENSPGTAVALALNLGREMSRRLRLANQTIFRLTN
jgi:sulfate permease, SulP family